MYWCLVWWTSWSITEDRSWQSPQIAPPGIALDWGGWLTPRSGPFLDIVCNQWLIVMVKGLGFSYQPAGFPSGGEVKNLPVHAGNRRDAGSIPGSWRCPGVGNGNPLQCSCLENYCIVACLPPVTHSTSSPFRGGLSQSHFPINVLHTTCYPRELHGATTHNDWQSYCGIIKPINKHL